MTNAANIATRGLSFDLVAEFDWQGALVLEDTRRQYGETRYQALGMIRGRLHMVVVTFREAHVRVISLRRANAERNVCMPRTAAKRIKPTAPDRDNPAWGDKEFAAAKPAADVLPSAVAKALGVRRRGPQATPTKEAVSIRLDRDVLDTLRASGPGWQGRVNDALRQALALGNRRLVERRKVS